LENPTSLESVFNRATWVGRADLMGRYDFFYHYYYSVGSNANEYSCGIMQMRTPSFVFPTSFAFGRKFGGTFVQLEGGVWGSFRDYVGDYRSEVISLSVVSQNTPVGEFGVEAFYTHFQRSAHIGSYSVDTGGGSAIVDFYEEWIYRDGFGMSFTHYGEDYNFTSGFAYTSFDGLVPMFVEFKKLLGSTQLTFRQTAFWGSTLLPPKLSFDIYREFVMGKRSLYAHLYVGFLMRPSDVFSLRRPPITSASLRYVSFHPSGEFTIFGRGYITKASDTEVGGEAYVSYRFARRWRPAITLGYLHTGGDRGPYVGVGMGRLGRRFSLTYYHALKAISVGVEVSHGVFAL